MTVKWLMLALVYFAVIPLAVRACLQTDVLRELRLVSFSVKYAECNSIAILSASVRNDGSRRETSILRFFVDGNEILDCTKIITIEPGSTVTGSCSWKTVAGFHRLRAMVEPLSGEVAMDNEQTLDVSIVCCREGFLEEYRCFYNWKQQKYQYVDCRTEWKNVGYCDSTSGQKICTPTYLEEYRCKGNWLQKKYQNRDCSFTWIDYTWCEYGCSGTSCLSKPSPVSARIITPTRAFTGDTKNIQVQFINNENRHIIVKSKVYLCSNFCWLMPCNSTVSIQPKSFQTFTCSHYFQDPGVYQVILEYEANGVRDTLTSGMFSVSNIRPAVYLTAGEYVEPFLIVQPYYTVNKCEDKTISFEVLNAGSKPHIFNISIEGLPKYWIDVPKSIAIAGLDKKTIYAHLSVPCDVEAGIYEFIIAIKDSKEVYKKSSIKVLEQKPFVPLITEQYSIPVELLVVLLVVLLAILVILVIIFVARKTNRRKEPEYFKGDC